MRRAHIDIKRPVLLCALLACAWLLCTALTLPAAALAQEKGSIRLVDIGPRDYWKENGISKKDVSYDQWGDCTQLLRGDDAADLMVLRSYNDDLSEYVDAGLLADLSGSETIREAVSRMTPSARAFITVGDGRILAVPHLHYENPFYWYQDAWDAAGLTEADVPQSYEGLLDFLDMWLARIAKTPETDVCVSRLLRWNTGKERYNYCWWLTETLLMSWEMQQRFAHEPIHFDNPQFVALAARSRGIALALYDAEPRQRKRESMMQLFQNDIRGGEYANNGRDYGYSHTIPMRVTDDQPALMAMSMDLYVVREGSAWMSEAIGFLESELANENWRCDYTLYTDFDPNRYPESGISQGWIDDYRGYEGAMVYYPKVFNVIRNAETSKESLMMKFFEGKVSAQEFASGLDAIIGYVPSEADGVAAEDETGYTDAGEGHAHSSSPGNTIIF